MLLLVGVSTFTIIKFTATKSPANILSKVLGKQTQIFKVYSPSPDNNLLQAMEIDENSASLSNGVLIYQVKLAGKQLAITEQSTPKDFDFTILKADREFVTLTGKAYITDGQSRTTGALFTQDGTWVLINAPEPIGGDTMQALINSMKPLP